MYIGDFEFTSDEKKQALMKKLVKEFPAAEGYYLNLMMEFPDNSATRAGDQIHGYWRFNKNDYPDCVQHGVRDGIGYIVSQRKPS